MSRLPTLRPEDMSPAQRRVADAIAAGPRGSVRGPLAVWLHSPGLAEHAQALGAYCRYGSALPPRLSELAILATAVHWRAGYEWQAHEPPARKGGLSEAVIEALRAGGTPAFEQEDEAIVYAVAQELFDAREIRPATFERAVALLGPLAVVDLVGVLGYYALISMTIKGFGIQPEGADPLG